MADETTLMWVDPGGGVRTAVILPELIFRTDSFSRELPQSEELEALVQTLEPDDPIVVEVADPKAVDIDAVTELARAHGRHVLVKAGGAEL